MPEASAGAAIVQESLPHTANVAVHVIFGTVALVLGLVQLLTGKGSARHVRRGRWFLFAVSVVVATAAVGSLVFAFRAFLAVITLLVAYQTYSGYRALRIAQTGPTLRDAMVSVLALGAALLFILYIRTVRFPWAPVVIYSTIGTLLAVAAYDLARFAFPKRWFQTLWLYEHLVKMLGAYTGVVSAFSGTVLGGWQPYSQLVPSLLLTSVMVGYVVHLERIRRRGGSRLVNEPAVTVPPDVDASLAGALPHGQAGCVGDEVAAC